MLRNFLYLDEVQLDSYLGVLEGGLSEDTLSRTTSTRKRGMRGQVGYGGMSAGAERGRENLREEERRLADSAEQRFDRLMQLLDEDPDRWGYEEVLDLADAWDRLAVGTLISVDCDVEIPSAVRLLAGGEELAGLVNMLDAMRPFAQMLGQDPDSLPGAQQTAAMRAFADHAGGDLVVVGEVDEDLPRVAGKLRKQFVRDIPEGEVCIVGKVAKRWDEGQYSLLSLPGASLLSRAQRRRQPQPPDTDDGSVLKGPALTLDVLAIFR